MMTEVIAAMLNRMSADAKSIVCPDWFIPVIQDGVIVDVIVKNAPLDDRPEGAERKIS